MLLYPGKNKCCSVKKRSADASDIKSGAWIKRTKRNSSSGKTDAASVSKKITSGASRKIKLPPKRHNVRLGLKGTRNFLSASRHLATGTSKAASVPSPKPISTDSMESASAVASGAF